MNWFYAYLLCLLILLLLDGVFIKFVATKSYRDHLGDLMRAKPAALPGVILYIFYIGAILLYGVWPLLHLLDSASWTQEWLKVAVWGAGLGLTTYGMYGLTNKALLKNWPTSVLLLDIAWGALLTAVTVSVGYAFLASR
jgi:uncharacterized membrane protein